MRNDFVGEGNIPFSFPRTRSIEFVARAMMEDSIGTRGKYIDQCRQAVLAKTKLHDCIMTSSATAALESVAWLMEPGEIIMPSYSFATTASVFARAGHKPVFVDVHEQDLTINAAQVWGAITLNTRAVLAVDYGGALAGTSVLRNACDRAGIFLIEDAAPAYGTMYAGTHAHFATFSFNDTKNIGCGEGGALCWTESVAYRLVNLLPIMDKGTNVAEMRQGKVKAYTWTAPGFAPRMTNLTAAALMPELNKADAITEERLRIFSRYATNLCDLRNTVWQPRSGAPIKFFGNGHSYWLVFSNGKIREIFMKLMTAMGIETARHYLALHHSPMGGKVARCYSNCNYSTSAENGIVRLPIYPEMASFVDWICEKVIACVMAAEAEFTCNA